MSTAPDDYDLELDRTAREIIKAKAKRVLIQLPDGLKPNAQEIVLFLQKKTKAEILIWGGSAFGACDIPIETKNLGVDFLVHYGHSQWVFDELP
jgi:2-(3-amino-3-carboxypropyl)histidine synthase